MTCPLEESKRSVYCQKPENCRMCQRKREELREVARKNREQTEVLKRELQPEFAW